MQWLFLKDSDVLNDEASISPILLENLKHASFISNKFIDDIDYKSHNRYFKSDKDLKIFIKFCSQNMIPVDVFWWSNLKGTGIRWRVYDLTHSKIKWDEASNLLSELTADKPSFLDENAKINITSLEQLKFLEAVSKDIEKDYLNVNIMLYQCRIQKENIEILLNFPKEKIQRVNNELI